MKKLSHSNVEPEVIRDIIDKTSIFTIERNFEYLKIEELQNNALVKIRCKNIKEILKIRNPYLSFYLMINCENEEFELDDKDAAEIHNILKQIKQVLENENMVNRFVDCFFKKMKNISTIRSLKILSVLSLSEKNINDIRKAFGYNVIYKAYKNIIEDIYLKDHTVDELGLTMILLDNEKLCFSQLLETFNKLNDYLSKEIIDKNLISCCVVLMAIIKYAPSRMANKSEFLRGMLSYLVNILFERSNFTFYNQQDTDTILETIESLCEMENVKLSSYKLKTGLVRKSLFNINLFLESDTSIYEEIMAFIAILRSLGIFLDLCHNTKPKDKKQPGRFKIVVLDNKHTKYNKSKEDLMLETLGFIENISSLLTSDLVNNLEKYKLPENVCLGYNDNILAKNRFYSAKYLALNNMSKIKKIVINRIHFYNDVYSQESPKFIFKHIQNIKNQISWSDLIILATHSPSKRDFVPILLDPFYTQNLEHLSYIFLFVFSLKEDYDSLLQLTIRLTELNSFDSVEKYWEILIYLYINYIEVNDTRIDKSRNYIIKKILKIKEKLNDVLKMLIKNCQKDDISINGNLYPLLFFIIFNLKEIDRDLFFTTYGYVEKAIEGIKTETALKNEETESVDEDLASLRLQENNFVIFRTPKVKERHFFGKLSPETLNVSLLINLLLIYKPTEEEMLEMFSFDSFSHCIAFSTYCRIQKASEEFLTKCLFNFVLNCSKRQREQLKIILKQNKRSKYHKSYKILKKLAKLQNKL